LPQIVHCYRTVAEALADVWTCVDHFGRPKKRGKLS
jgi:hypothetical protein